MGKLSLKKKKKQVIPFLLCEFKYIFLVFKQHYIYLQTLFHSHVFPKKLKTTVYTHVSNGPKFWCTVFWIKKISH